jgi:homoserine O-succinyltransferase
VTVEVEQPRARGQLAGAGSADTVRSRHAVARTDEPLLIGLVNNMPDTAVEGTEIQFGALLAAASGARTVRVRYSTLPEVPRGAAVAARIAARYWPLEELYRDPPDALIVTGTEPRAATLSDEPYWDRLVELMQFAQQQVQSSAWSCLAAHAAVQHLDGISRRRLPVKRSGVYRHDVLAGHPLTVGVPASLPTPHSRWNDLPLEALIAAGYQILSRSDETGADAFVKPGAHLMVFFQGHPEYEERTLLKEFQRDVGRFVAGQQDRYPALPAGYFGADARQLLDDFERQLLAGNLREPLAAFPFSAVAATLVNSWSAPAARIYANWLEHIAHCKRNPSASVRRAL